MQRPTGERALAQITALPHRDDLVSTKPQTGVYLPIEWPSRPCVGGGNRRAHLHDDALGAAAGALAGLADIHLALRGAGAERTAAGRVGGHLLVVAADLADEVVEGVLDVDAGLGGGFDELAAELAGQSFALCTKWGLACVLPTPRVDLRCGW